MAERTGERMTDRAHADRAGDGDRIDRDRYDEGREPAGRERAAGPAAVQRRQRAEYGGFNVGAAFFGWLVAVGMAVLLTALLSAAGAAIGLTELTEGEAKSNAGTISIVGGILLIVVLALSYYAGGYVAGRMSRFDGGRQGLGVWIMGLLVTVALAVLGAVAGSEWNLFSQVNLPRIPIDEGSLATGAAIALVVILLSTLVAAIVGGKAGERYHRKVDRAGYEGTEPRRRAATA
jgi:MFS family permease